MFLTTSTNKCAGTVEWIIYGIFMPGPMGTGCVFFTSAGVGWFHPPVCQYTIYQVERIILYTALYGILLFTAMIIYLHPKFGNAAIRPFIY